jgi:hypothetical protein
VLSALICADHADSHVMSKKRRIHRRLRLLLEQDRVLPVLLLFTLAVECPTSAIARIKNPDKDIFFPRIAFVFVFVCEQQDATRVLITESSSVSCFH